MYYLSNTKEKRGRGRRGRGGGAGSRSYIEKEKDIVLVELLPTGYEIKEPSHLQVLLVNIGPLP